MVIFRLFDNRNIIIKKLQPWKDCEMKVIRWALVSPHSDFATIHNNSGHSNLVHLPCNVKPTPTWSQSQQLRQYQTGTNIQIPRRSRWQRQVPHRPWKVQSRHLSGGAFACWCFLACLWGSQADFKINMRSHLDVIISLHSYEAGGHLL